MNSTLTGKVIRLEPLNENHASSLFQYLGNDPEVWRWLLHPIPIDIVEMRNIISSYIAQRTTGWREPFAIIDLATGDAIGTTSFMDIDISNRNLEIGSTFFSSKFWRSAVNTEAKLLLLTEAFEERNMIRVSLKTDRLNIRSQAAIVRIGATLEGTLRHHRIRPDGTLRDSACYSILADEWPSAKAALLSRN
jgi:N-acetyltransferase